MVSHNSNDSTLPEFANHLFRIFAEWIVDVFLLQVGMKCFSMRMSFDPYYKLLNSGCSASFTTECDSPGTLKSIFVFLFLIHRDGFPRTCSIIFNMSGCHNATFCGFVSRHGFPCSRWICDLIMFLLIKSVAIKLGTFQGLFSPSSNRSHCT